MNLNCITSERVGEKILADDSKQFLVRSLNLNCVFRYCYNKP